ncbi:MAG: LysR family transcriptional regulator, partial [Bdellovibrionota bacterium]
MMTLDHWRYFLAAAEQESIVAASKELHISPSAISHAIRGLEDSLGWKVFEKRGKRIFLTRGGRALKEELEKLFPRILRLPELGTQKGGELRGHVRLGSTLSLGTRAVVPAFSRLQTMHPRLTVDFKTGPSSSLFAQVLSGGLDLAICYGPLSHPDLASRAVHDDKFSVVVRKKHTIRKSPASQRAAVLSELPAIAPRKYSGRKNLELKELERLGIAQNVGFTFDSYEIARARVENTQEWALL